MTIYCLSFPDLQFYIRYTTQINRIKIYGTIFNLLKLKNKEGKMKHLPEKDFGITPETCTEKK